MTSSSPVDPGPLRALMLDLAEFFAARDVDAWATGGFLRDLLLARNPHDIDLSVSGEPLRLGPELAEKLGGHYFPLREERGQVRIMLPERHIQIDLMPLRAQSIEGDLRLRDFTIDALATALAEVVQSAGLLDPTGGRDDLNAGLVRMTSEQALIDDPLRLLRGVRIATELGFEVEGGTAEAIRGLAARVKSAAEERRRDEIVRICSTDRAGSGFRQMDNLGLFSSVFPEMEAARGVQQPKEHHYDVLGHSFAAVDACDWLLATQPPDRVPESEMWSILWSDLAWCEGLRDYFDGEITPGSERGAITKLCALLHDIAKPETKSMEADGRMRFFGHSEKGAEIATSLMRRLRFSARETRMVASMIEAHLRPLQLGQTGAPSRKAVYRFFRDTGDAGVATLFLSLADHLASVGPRVTVDGFQRHVALVNYILHMRFHEGTTVIEPGLVDGDILMAALELEPGPVIGELLEAVREAQAAGEVQTTAQALELARSRLAEIRAGE